MDALHKFLMELEGDSTLADAGSLQYRIEALDRIEAWLQNMDRTDMALSSRVNATCERLEALNAALYQEIRADIRLGRGAGRLQQWIPTAAGQGRGHEGYDHLDELVGGILQFDEPRLPMVELAAEMVFYQPTPARHIFEMIARSGLREGDVLMDLGSGMGHVPLLAAICTGACAIGIELEPAYVECARQVAAALNLDNARFMQCDARMADFSVATVFYLYTPFKGAILRDVLDRLRQEAMRREIRICTFGPCTAAVVQEPWLITRDAPETDRMVLFRRAGVESEARCPITG